MTEIRDNIRNSLALSVVSSLLIGVAMNYGYGYARGMLAPFGAFIGENLIDPYSEWLWWKTALLNFAYSAVCGLLVAMVSLAVMQYLLKPKQCCSRRSQDFHVSLQAIGGL